MTSAIELIKMFYTEGFFSSWKSLKDVRAEFEKKGFNFSDQLISMSLSNATKRGLLSRRKNGKIIQYSQRQPPEIKIKEKETSEINRVLSEMTKKN